MVKLDLGFKEMEILYQLSCGVGCTIFRNENSHTLCLTKRNRYLKIMYKSLIFNNKLHFLKKNEHFNNPSDITQEKQKGSSGSNLWVLPYTRGRS